MPNQKQELEEQYRRADGSLDLPTLADAKAAFAEADRVAEEERIAAEKAAWREKIGSVGFTKSIQWRRGKQRTKGF